MVNDIYPYYHPTKTIFIDDNVEFVNQITRLVDNENCEAFSSAREALKKVNYSPLDVYQLCHCNVDNELSTSAQAISWDFSMIKNKVLDSSRFDEVSVAVVDYDMPELNGLDFCAQISRQFVKKILLTGFMDINAGANSLSRNQANSYIQKTDPDLFNKLKEFIELNKKLYFDDIKKKFINSGAELPSFFNSNAFQTYFSHLCEKHHIVEYYLTVDPTGMLMLGANKNEYYRLLVYTAEDLKAHHEVAEDQGADQGFLEKLANKEVIPDFGPQSEFYSPAYGPELEKYLFEPDVINGSKELYYCHLRMQPPAYTEFLDKTISYHSTASD